MSVIGMSLSYERSTRARMDDLRRQAFQVAQARLVTGTAGTRLAATLRALAARLERSERHRPGPWREDFWEPVGRHA